MQSRIVAILMYFVAYIYGAYDVAPILDSRPPESTDSARSTLQRKLEKINEASPVEMLPSNSTGKVQISQLPTPEPEPKTTKLIFPFDVLPRRLRVTPFGEVSYE